MGRGRTCRKLQSAMVAIDDDDILIEILLWLSTKLLVQLKAVCKRWRSLISSHQFSVLHTLRHPTTKATTANLILRDWRFKSSNPALQSKHSYKIQFPFATSSYIIQSCHGLLLCGFESRWDGYCIYNLATRLWRSFDIERYMTRGGLTLAFDPSKSAYYKLIYIKPTDSFKEYHQYLIDVYDSKSSSWSTVVKSFTVPLDVDLSNGIYWNNSIHWEEKSSGTMYFDIDKGVIGTSPKVPTISRITSSYGLYQIGWGPLLVESGGHLYYIIKNGLNLGVLELEKDYSKWSIKYQVDYSRLTKAFPSSCRLLGIVPTQNEEQSVLLLGASDKLMAYNHTDESFEELLDMNGRRYPFLPCHVRHFVETLAPV